MRGQQIPTLLLDSRPQEQCYRGMTSTACEVWLQTSRPDRLTYTLVSLGRRKRGGRTRLGTVHVGGSLAPNSVVVAEQDSTLLQDGVVNFRAKVSLVNKSFRVG